MSYEVILQAQPESNNNIFRGDVREGKLSTGNVPCLLLFTKYILLFLGHPASPVMTRLPGLET